MTNQSMMVPPNNAPWPGLQAPSHSQPPTSPPTYPHSHPHHAHSSSYPPPSPYYHHPPPPPHHPHHGPPPPPPHHGHPPPPHHGPPPPPPHHYPYHPYGAPYPPPYPAHSSSHPAYHHPPHHPSGHHPPPPPGSHNPSAPSSTSATAAVAETLSESAKAIKAKPATSSNSNSKAKAGKAGSESFDSASASSATGTTSVPKTFRFEGSISSETFKTTKSFDLAGVNILNRKPMDARTALDKLQRRRETHNRVERKRRDCINQLIDDLTKLLPPKHLEEASSKCHRVNVLRGAVAHIKFLSESNSGLVMTLDAAKSEGFKLPEVIDVVPSATASSEKVNSSSAETADQGMSMDVDMEDSAEANPVKQEDADDDMKETSSNDTPSRTSSPAVSSSSKQSASASPRLTPSKVLGHPQLVVTDAPSPKTERPSSREALVPPPISISSASVDPYSLESHPTTVTSISESTTPVSPAFPASPKSNTSTASSSLHQGSFQTKDNNSKQQLQQQLSPFMKTISMSTSPSLPPISSLASLNIQSPAARVEDPSGERHFQVRSGSPTFRAAAIPSSSSNHKIGPTQRTGPTLPPLKIPAPQHLHPSYKHSTHDSRANNHSGPTLSPHQQATSPYPQLGSEEEQHPQQPPVSPFMLSPLMSRSPSMGPLSASSAGTSPYPHWGHEGPEGAGAPLPPPHHQGQYLPPHGYPHGYPYPYPYHPSYGYPHHPPPPHHHHPHHHHAPPSPHSPQQRPTSPYPAAATAPRPEPIFIQEEPWNVQRKRSTSGKTQSGKQQSSAANTTKKAKEGSVIREAREEESTPVSPTSSVASTASSYPSPNSRRKRPSSSSHHKGGSGTYEGIAEESAIKRVRQHDESSSPRLEFSQNGQDQHRSSSSNKDEDHHQQRDSGIVVVVVKADEDHHRHSHTHPLSPATSSHHEEMAVDQGGEHHHRDAAQALTSLSQNAA
ncbi:hypothetical protein EC957_009048 [Mortierella hygrophila]|uniref:BHLH domain-containing protein n=1 Tax=Mortierella hygrophila TaxID=979708 RepID=A0A9P6JXD8_9FUNG|nr:hypothetical protein EC957_009048 [Mortierella hygrophila]